VSEAQAKVAEVSNMMQNNLNNIMSNGADLDEMSDKAEGLKASAFNFRN